MFFVYVYYHPLTTLPFYVGKGTGDRDMYHWWNKNNHYNESLGKILQELHTLGQQPHIERVLTTDIETEAYDEERKRISMYGRLDLDTGSLCNRTPGGEGFGNTGTTWSDSQRRKRELTNYQYPKGVGFTKYTLVGDKLTTYANTHELSHEYSKTQIMAIRRCCKGDRFSVSGFRWSYDNAALPAATTTMKRVRQFTKTGELVSEFISVAEASRVTGINQGDIAGVARGNTKLSTAGGFKWTY